MKDKEVLLLDEEQVRKRSVTHELRGTGAHKGVPLGYQLAAIPRFALRRTADEVISHQSLLNVIQVS